MPFPLAFPLAFGEAYSPPVFVDDVAGELGFGSDLFCDSDLTARMDEIDGFTALALGQALVRRLDCPRGQLPDDPDYGIDVRAMLNRGTTTAELSGIAAKIRAELLKDDRVDAIEVTVSPSSTGTALFVSIRVTPVDPRVGVFSLTLRLTDAAILLEQMRGEQ